MSGRLSVSWFHLIRHSNPAIITGSHLYIVIQRTAPFANKQAICQCIFNFTLLLHSTSRIVFAKYMNGLHQQKDVTDARWQSFDWSIVLSRKYFPSWTCPSRRNHPLWDKPICRLETIHFPTSIPVSNLMKCSGESSYKPFNVNASCYLSWFPSSMDFPIVFPLDRNKTASFNEVQPLHSTIPQL